MQTANDQGFGGTSEVVIDIEDRTALNSREGIETPRVACATMHPDPSRWTPDQSKGYEAL